MEIRKPQHDAIIWSEQFPNYNREKSYIKCESCSSCNFNGRRMYCGTFIVHIYRKEDYHFKCGIDEFGQYFVENKKF